MRCCDYSHGYRKALCDVVDWFERHSQGMAYNRAYAKNPIEALLKAMAKEHEAMEKYGASVVFVLKRQDKKCEVVIDKERTERGL